MTTKELETKVANLETALAEMQGAIRRLGTESNNLVNMVVKLSEKDGELLSQLARLELEIKKSRAAATPTLGGQINRYE